MSSAFNRSSKLALVVILVLVLASVFPLFWMASTAFKTPDQIFTRPPTLLPPSPTLQNFAELFNSVFMTFVKNSVIVSSGAVALSLVVAVLAGYSFSRFRFKGQGLVQLFILMAQMFPLVLLLISIYVFFAQLRLLDTRFSLVIAHCTFALPFSVWMLKGFFDSVPRELEEAAHIDGCSRTRILLQIVLPLVKPGLVATGIYIFLLSWDDYIFALQLISSLDKRTVPVGLVLSFLGEFQYAWGPLMAGSILVSLPVMLMFVYVQRHLVAGLTAGAVKG